MTLYYVTTVQHSHKILSHDVESYVDIDNKPCIASYSSKISLQLAIGGCGRVAYVALGVWWLCMVDGHFHMQ